MKPWRIILWVLGGLLALLLAALLYIALIAHVFMFAGDTRPMPADDEMRDHFLRHEAAYEAIYDIVFEHCPYGYHYPPHDDADTACLRGIDPECRHALDSLLGGVGCKRIYYAGRAARREQNEKWGRQRDTTDISITFSYWSRGLSISGTGKNIVCNPDSGAAVVDDGADLNDLYRGLMRDTTLLKRIRGKWYIELEYDR